MNSINPNSEVSRGGSPIDLATAVAWTGAYQEAHHGELRSCYFSAEVFQALLNQAGTKGIRIYLANNGTNDCMILASATPDQDFTASEYQLYEYGRCCPPYCPTESRLNHNY